MKRDASELNNDNSKRKNNLKYEFDELKVIYMKLMSYYTFLSTRKHIITTFDLLKPPVEKAIKRPLAFQDISMIKTLMPNDIIFEYVDKEQFILEEKHFSWKDGFKQNEQDVFELKELNKKDNQLLIIEFIDGDVTKSKARMGFNSNVKVPQYSTEAIKKLIQKRQGKFEKALQDFKDLHPLDAWDLLKFDSGAYLPEKFDLIDPMKEMNEETIESNHKPIEKVIDSIKKAPFYDQQIAGPIHIMPSKPTKYGELTSSLNPEIWKLLNLKGIEKLYSHQTKGIDSILNFDKHVVSTTATSSGKSLIYQLPILNALIETPQVTSILLFPTKALAQDQYRTLIEFANDLSISSDLISTYDGDTDLNSKQWIRENSSIILTNPDTLHLSIIPQYEKWSRVLRNLKYIIIDEMHTYKGTFGSHVALIMRRLRRVCSLFGNLNIQFISSSATLKDAKQHMSKMTGIDEDLIDWINENDDGAPHGSRHLIGWKPNVDHNGSMIADTAKIIIELTKLSIRTIVFCSIRKTVELVMKEIRVKLRDNRDLLKTIMSYRGGYSAKDRRKIEERMFNGSLNCIIATNALEVGIDIGGLDAVVMCGFPVSLSSFEQEMGRAGRRGLESMCLLIAGSDPVSNHYITKMDELVNNKDWDDLCVDLKNILILELQLQCAFKELPVRNEDLSVEWLNWFNFIEWDIFETIIRDKLKWDADWQKWTCSDSYLPHPPSFVSIRNIEEESYAVVDTTGETGRQEIIEQIETSRLPFTLYEGGIFIHQGLPYIVRELNIHDKYAIVERTNVDWTTSQRDYTDVDPVLIERIKSLKANSIHVYFGNILKTSIVFGFFKVDRRGQILDVVEVKNPPVKYNSKGVWIDINSEILEIIKDHKLNIPGAIHACQHAIMNIIPKSISVGSKDELSCECKAPEKEFAARESKRKRPSRLILYDSRGGKIGSGLSAKIFDSIETILKLSLQEVESCDCQYGCPNCCAGLLCTENSLVLSKWGCQLLFRCLLNYRNPRDGIPEGPEPNLPEIEIETVAPCEDFGSVQVSSVVEVEDDEAENGVSKEDQQNNTYPDNDGFNADEGAVDGSAINLKTEGVIKTEEA